MEDLKRSPGRPKVLTQKERRQRILDVAGELFIEEGYEATDMKRIAERCGMSKKTLYQVFQNKEDLFATLVCDPEGNSYVPFGENVDGSEEMKLVKTLMRLASWVLAPRQIGLTRLIISESRKTPDLATRFREQAIEIGRRSILARLKSISVVTESQDQLENLASIIFGAVMGDMQLRALAGEDIDEFRNEAQLRQRIVSVVNVFVLRDRPFMA